MGAGRRWLLQNVFEIGSLDKKKSVLCEFCRLVGISLKLRYWTHFRQIENRCSGRCQSVSSCMNQAEDVTNIQGDVASKRIALKNNGHFPIERSGGLDFRNSITLGLSLDQVKVNFTVQEKNSRWMINQNRNERTNRRSTCHIIGCRNSLAKSRSLKVLLRVSEGTRRRENALKVLCRFRKGEPSK